MIGELERALELAQSDLDQSTQRLEDMERQVGSDLGELRILNDSGAGDSNLRRSLNQVKSELRQARSVIQDNLQLRDLLAKASTNPDELLATPSRLLEAQPGLRRLKDGLVDAQLDTSKLLGRMSKDHPAVIAAMRAEQEVRTNLHAEVASALRGVEADLEVSESQLKELDEQRIDLQQRLDQLASLRARYSNLVDDVRQRTEIVQKAKKSLADARASQTVAASSSQLTRFHEPVAGDTPEGPGRLTLVAAGLFGGLATGAGVVFLVIPLAPVGRRATDRMLGRRAEDRLTARPIHPQDNRAPSRRESDRTNQASPPKTPVQDRRGADMSRQRQSASTPVEGTRSANRTPQPASPPPTVPPQGVPPRGRRASDHPAPPNAPDRKPTDDPSRGVSQQR